MQRKCDRLYCTKTIWAEMDAWEMTIKTPNGYNLQLEKTGKD